jgi:DnaJ-class molecular chaperone
MQSSRETTDRRRHCEALELPWDRALTETEIEAAWRQANLRWHPRRPTADLVMHRRAATAYPILIAAPEPAAPQVPQPSTLSLASPQAPAGPPPPYSIQTLNGAQRLCLELKVPLRTLVGGGRIAFTHLDGKEYSLNLPPGSWGGWAELPGLGQGSGPLLVILQPLFPQLLTPEARTLICQGLDKCAADTHSLMLHELMPELTK